MRLTATELRALLPLLRPDVEVEIVLHGPVVIPDLGVVVAPILEPTATPVRRTRKASTRWTPEARKALGERIRQTKANKRAQAEIDQARMFREAIAQADKQ